MLRTILVPIDGSPFSERALTLAVPLALQHQASVVLTLAHPVPPQTGERGGGASARDPQMDRDVRQFMRQQLERTARRIATRHHVTTATQFREGPVVEELDAVIADVSPDLVVMATHGRGGVSRLWLGSVTDALLRRTTTPVLVTRQARKWTKTTADEPLFPRVVVAVDGSPLSERALEETLRLLGDMPCHVVLVRAVDTPITAVTGAWIAEITQEMTETYLQPLAARHHGLQRHFTTRAVVHADPARAILDVAKEERAFMIAIATHGRTGVRRAVLGSVADKVIRAATMPVLVRPPGPGEAPE